MSRIQSALERIYAQQRLVFWYDAEQEWRGELLTLTLPEVKVIEVKNDEFGVKHRVMREERDKKFLIYIPTAKPADTENWLLDLVLANHEFRADRVSLVLQEVGLPYEFKELVTRHIDFFKSAERQEKLKAMLTANDVDRDVLLKMIAVTCRGEPSLESILFNLFAEMAEGKSERFDQIPKFKLDTFFWRELSQCYGYSTIQPSLKDFVIELFRSNAPLEGQPRLNRESRVLFSRWKDSAKFQGNFEVLSEQIADTLKISDKLNQFDEVQTLQDCDAYKAIDRRIIHELRNGLAVESMGTGVVRDLISRRESTHWFPEYQHLYRALMYAADFLERVKKVDLEIESFEDGLEKYHQTFHQLDLLYRKFIYHQQQAGEANLMAELTDKVEKLYANAFLLPLNDRWQHWVDAASEWRSSKQTNQPDFFKTFVQPFVDKGNKVFVIVSDALRYEIATELMERIAREDRFTAQLKPMLGCLPSCTQIGMAALLPHRTLAFAAEGGNVLVDGKNSAGTESRSDILAAKLNGRATVLKARDFLDMPARTEGRELFKNNDVIYIYHNGIDAVGDKRDTDYKVFEAVEMEIRVLIELIKKVAAVNGTNMLITADHGFLYQSLRLDEADFAEIPKKEAAQFYNRRFVIGKNLSTATATRKFQSKQLGLEGDTEILIPKSIQRLRLQGAGAQYVHGGASLQEIVLPVVEVHKARTSDIEKVEVDLIRPSTQITTGQVTINLYQEQPVSEKCLPRELRIGFFSTTGVALSDIKALRFDSDNPDARARERKEQFVFSRQADKFNNQDVVLRLDEAISGTNQVVMYREFTFRLKRAFESDFDQF